MNQTAPQHRMDVSLPLREGDHRAQTIAQCQPGAIFPRENRLVVRHVNRLEVNRLWGLNPLL